MTAASPPSLAIVLGSATPPGRLHRAIGEAAARARERGGPVQVIDLAECRIAFADGRSPNELDDDTAATIERLAAADSIVLATPVYRGSMTGALKNLLDQMPVAALRGKPTGLVAMGASDHHFLGAERHLRDVLAFFGAVTMPVAVYLRGADFEAGEPTPRCAELLDGLLDGVLALAAALGGPESDGRVAEALIGPPAPIGVLAG